jgi:hypothetical protein
MNTVQIITLLDMHIYPWIHIGNTLSSRIWILYCEIYFTCDLLLIIIYPTFELKILYFINRINFPQEIGRYFLFSQFLGFLLENVLLDLNPGAVFEELLKPLE